MSLPLLIVLSFPQIVPSLFSLHYLIYQQCLITTFFFIQLLYFLLLLVFFFFFLKSQSFTGFSFSRLLKGMLQVSAPDFFPLIFLCTCFLGDLNPFHGFMCNLNANDSQICMSMPYFFPEFHTHKLNYFFCFLHFCLNVVTIMGLFFLKSISHSPLFSSAHTGPDFCSLCTSEIPESWLPSGIKPWETHIERHKAGEKEGCNYSPVLVSLLIAVTFLPWLQLL